MYENMLKIIVDAGFSSSLSFSIYWGLGTHPLGIRGNDCMSHMVGVTERKEEHLDLISRGERWYLRDIKGKREKHPRPGTAAERCAAMCKERRPEQKHMWYKVFEL